MSTLRILAAAAFLAAGAASHAAPAQGANPDGFASPRAAPGPTLAASARGSLARAELPSASSAPLSVKAAADADIHKRRTQPRLKAERQNLKEDEAARVQAQQQTPATFDRDMSLGNKDHTEQVTNLKVYIKK